MMPEEFQARYHLRKTSGPRSCTGEDPCVCSASTCSGAWYCRACIHPSGNRLWLGGDPDHVVCDRWAGYQCTTFPSYTPSSSSVE